MFHYRVIGACPVTTDCIIVAMTLCENNRYLRVCCPYSGTPNVRVLTADVQNKNTTAPGTELLEPVL